MDNTKTAVHVNKDGFIPVASFHGKKENPQAPFDYCTNCKRQTDTSFKYKMPHGKEIHVCKACNRAIKNISARWINTHLWKKGGKND